MIYTPNRRIPWENPSDEKTEHMRWVKRANRDEFDEITLDSDGLNGDRRHGKHTDRRAIRRTRGLTM